MSLGERLGVRAFDANLVIAVVQDRVRRGESWREWLGGAAAADVGGGVEQDARRERFLGRALLIAVLASTISGLLTAWTLGMFSR